MSPYRCVLWGGDLIQTLAAFRNEMPRAMSPVTDVVRWAVPSISSTRLHVSRCLYLLIIPCQIDGLVSHGAARHDRLVVWLLRRRQVTTLNQCMHCGHAMVMLRLPTSMPME